MKKNKMLLGIFAIVAMVSLMGQPTFAKQTQEKEHVHQYVVGTVSAIKGKTVFLDTETGNRSLSKKEFETEQISNIREGDRFLLEIDEGNQIIDLDRIMGPGIESHPEGHQTLKGNLVSYDRKYKIIILKLSNGTAASYKLKEVAATKINHVKLGSVVEIEIDEENGFVNDFLVD